jgi:hypothetical protein
VHASIDQELDPVDVFGLVEPPHTMAALSRNRPSRGFATVSSASFRDKDGCTPAIRDGTHILIGQSTKMM